MPVFLQKADVWIVIKYRHIEILPQIFQTVAGARRTAAVQKQPPVMIRKLIDQVFQFFLIVNFVHFSSYSHAKKFYILTIFFCIGIF